MARSFGPLFGRITDVFTKLDKGFGGRAFYAPLSVLLIAAAIAFMSRALPARWGFILSEFDPWWHFKTATMIIERGWAGFFEYGSLHDYKSWYPTGLAVGKVFYPGVSFTLAFIYLTLSSLGISVDLLELASILPVVYGVLAIFITFLLARYVLGTGPAVASALLLSMSYAHISRTHLGWLDDEALAIPLMHAAFLTYLVSIEEKRSLKSSAALGLLTGLLLGYTGATWGAHRFPIMLVFLFTALLLFMGRYRRQFLASYAPMLASLAVILVSVPKLGLSYLFEITLLSGFMVLAYLALAEALYRFWKAERAVIFLRAIALILLVSTLALAVAAVVNLPGLKFLSVVLPQLRGELVIIASVAENQAATWSTLFNDFGLTLLLVPFAIFLLLRRAREGDVFLVVYAVLSLYFASSLVRLALPTSPVVAILAGYALTELLALASRNLSPPRGMRLRRTGERRYLIAVPLIVLMLISLQYLPRGMGNTWGFSPLDAAYTPSTISSSSIPTGRDFVLNDWLRAVEWMRNNLPDNAVVAAWWDYGNWISIVANRTSLVDNTTVDNIKIAKVGYALLSPLNVSRSIFKEMGATHVLIFISHRPQTGATDYPRLLYYGDESKWFWMLRIANQHARELGYTPISEVGLLGPNRDPINPTNQFWTNTTLGQLIPFKPRQTSDQFGNIVTAHYYEEPRVEGYRLVFSSSQPYTSLAYVYIYEITD
ncbi:MAG: STT3 domain-containing protein [Nitrososphaerota archaeon]